MSKKKSDRPHGHYCKICGEYKANEKFSGKGHATHKHHAHRRRTVSQRPPGQKKQRNAEKRTAAKTNQLPFCHVERDLTFDPREVLGYGNICHFQHSFRMGA